MADRHPLRDRHRLAQHLHDTARARELDDFHTGHAGAFADAVIEVGWRPPARVITSAADLHALPAESVVLSVAAAEDPENMMALVWVHEGDGSWAEPGTAERVSVGDILLPVRVLYLPTENGDTDKEADDR
jgi:hypothetical protein